MICTRDRPALLQIALAAVTASSYPSFDVIVVDNGSAPDTTRAIVARHDATYVAEPVVGLSRARNAGARASTAEILAYIDDDAVPETGWLTALARPFEDPRVMFAGGRVIPSRPETSAGRLTAEIGSLDAGETPRVADAATPGWFELAMGGGLGYGMNMAIRRSAFDVWRGFDERLGRGAPLLASEDGHAILELIELGYRIAYAPAAVVRHPDPRTRAQVRTRYPRDVAAASAYFVMLFVERPRHRRDAVRYALQALAGRGRNWRPAPPLRPAVVPRWRVWLALASGPLLYGRGALSGRRTGR